MFQAQNFVIFSKKSGIVFIFIKSGLDKYIPSSYIFKQKSQ